MQSIILASSSKYKQQLLLRTGIPFADQVSNFDERSLDHIFQESPMECAQRIAEGKARDVAGIWQRFCKNNPRWVLATDQIVWCELENGQKHQFHKPGTEEAALEQLWLLSGRTFYSTTGLFLLYTGTEAHHQDVQTETLVMRNYTPEEAEASIRMCRPLDCAGSYRIEDASIRLFKEIRGDMTGCQGFPVIRVLTLLREAGCLPA